MKKIILLILFILQSISFVWADPTKTVPPYSQKIDSSDLCDAYRTKQLLLNLLIDDYMLTLNYRYPSDITLSDARLIKIDPATHISQCKISIFRAADTTIGKKLIKDEVIYDVKKIGDNKITIVLPGILK